jgi:hypothetical protein
MFDNVDNLEPVIIAGVFFRFVGTVLSLYNNQQDTDVEVVLRSNIL